jgi:pimeloyl-ACP methyl ester carboxylesterase
MNNTTHNNNIKPQSPPIKSYGFWLKRGVAILGIILVALVIAGASYQSIATRIDVRKYPPPGQLVDVGGYKLHLYCTGTGGPTVVLDALFPGTVSNWAWVQPEIAKVTSVCAYDRAGLGWSDAGPEPRDARQHATELHALLTNAGVPGPYVLVGHSLGGLSVRMFADLYPDEVAGMVLVEGTNPDGWKRLGLPEGVGTDTSVLKIGLILARFGVFRSGLLSFYTTDTDLPLQQQQELQAYFNSVKALETVRAVAVSFSESLEQVRNADNIGSKPLAVVLGSEGDGSLETV